MIVSRYHFSPETYETELVSLIGDLLASDRLDKAAYEAIVRRHPKDGKGLFSKSEIIRGFRHLSDRHHWPVGESDFVARLRMKPIRTQSGVTPVTVLTKPFSCPGQCIFCPSDVRMPKSYLSSEPGAQRAAQHRFDPYAQCISRLKTYHNIGHPVDKVELIVLGGTWSYYPESYQLWFVKRCLDALNDFSPDSIDRIALDPSDAFDYAAVEARVDGRKIGPSYNQLIASLASETEGGHETASWEDVERAQHSNEAAEARCVGLVVETRPDHLNLDEVVRIRRLGCTKVQIGYQSLSDRILRLNRRGHTVAATRRAMWLLRAAGFKIHAHWMPNLYGSSPQADAVDFTRIFADRDFRPDELKIYPCSLIESAELMSYYESGEWRPYSRPELLSLLTECLTKTPEYCRLTRVIRDIPGQEIVAGNRTTNFRQVVEEELADAGVTLREIRSREIGSDAVTRDELALEVIDYSTSIGSESFLQWVRSDGRIAAFLRLSLPSEPVPIPEIRHSAMIREVHVYGQVTTFGQREGLQSQHLGLGRALIAEAEARAAASGYRDLAVISAIGTRAYYRDLGFSEGALYQHLQLA